MPIALRRQLSVPGRTSQDPHERIDNLQRILDQSEAERVPLLQRSLVVGTSIQVLSAFAVTVPDDWLYVGAAGAPAFGTNYANLADGANHSPVRFRKSSDGFNLEVAGVGKVTANVAAFSTAFTLPAAYLPRFFDVYTGTANEAFCPWEIVPAGAGAGNVTPRIALTSGWYWDLNCSCAAASATGSPVAASCWPIDVPHSLGMQPAEVRIASCVNTSNTASNIPIAPLGLSWTPTPGAITGSIRVLNVAGLPPGAYSITLVAWGA